MPPNNPMIARIRTANAPMLMFFMAVSQLPAGAAAVSTGAEIIVGEGERGDEVG